MLVKVDPFRSPGPPYLKATVDEDFAGQDGQEGGGYLMFRYLRWGVLSTKTEALRTDGRTQSFTQVMCY